MPNKHQSLTYRWMQEVWNEGNEDAIDKMLDENAVVHGIEGINERGPKGFKSFHENFKKQFPTIHVEVDDVFSEAGYETSRCTVDGATANGQKVHFTGMTCVKVENNKIVEAWNSFDFLTMHQQLGFKMTAAEEMIA